MKGHAALKAPCVGAFVMAIELGIINAKSAQARICYLIRRDAREHVAQLRKKGQTVPPELLLQPRRKARAKKGGAK